MSLLSRSRGSKGYGTCRDVARPSLRPNRAKARCDKSECLFLTVENSFFDSQKRLIWLVSGREPKAPRSLSCFMWVWLTLGQAAAISSQPRRVRGKAANEFKSVFPATCAVEKLPEAKRDASPSRRRQNRLAPRRSRAKARRLCIRAPVLPLQIKAYALIWEGAAAE